MAADRRQQPHGDVRFASRDVECHLDRVYGPDCNRVLSGQGVGTGLRVADLGCGTGSTALWLASEVGPSGEVQAVELSQDQLAVAATRASDEGLGNIQFTQASADATNLARDAYDVVHCRFLLNHVVEPLPVIREMKALAKPGGLVIAFEMDANGLYSFPPTPCYEQLRALLISAGKSQGKDLEIGPKLPMLFENAGLSCSGLALIHPIYLRGEEKRLWEFTMREARPYHGRYGWTVADYDRLAEALAVVGTNATTTVAQVPLVACWARKAD